MTKQIPVLFYYKLYVLCRSYSCNKYIHFQTVASIEQRTRPNLSKTLKGNSPLACVLMCLNMQHVFWVLWICSVIIFRAGIGRRTGIGSRWCHHSTDGPLQASFHHMMFWGGTQKVPLNARSSTVINILLLQNIGRTQQWNLKTFKYI